MGKRRVMTLAAACALLPGMAALTPAAAARKMPIRTPIVAAEPDSPLLILVSLRKQRLRVFDIMGERTSSRVSSGQPGFDTPTGVFSILEKKEHHESNIYEGAEMPFMQRITWSGIALHQGNVPGYRASHGCIRLPASFARSLFDVTRTGNRVVVTQDETAPVPFQHPKLYKPLPLNAPREAALPSTEPKLAANDVSPAPGSASDTLAELPRYIGVTPALAEAAAGLSPPKPKRATSRSEVDAELSDKQKALQETMRLADAARAAATEAAKIAVKNAEAATAELEAAARPMAPQRAAIAAAETRHKAAVAAFKAFMDGKASAAPGKGSIEDREADLEDAILDATIDLDAAKAAAATAEAGIAAIKAAAEAADKARLAALDDVRQKQAELRSAQTALIEANKDVVRRSKPVSVFISLKAQRIYVRQGFEPLFEAPIPVSGDITVGTHVFTAMRYAANQNDFDWHLVSAHTPAAAVVKRRTPGGTRATDLAAAALDAFTIPEDILATITELARPGASLIVSDRELPLNENGLGTEFVVLTR